MLKAYGLVGLAVIGAAEAALFGGVRWVGVNFTPIVWTGYILFADSLVYRLKGSSLLMTRRGELKYLLPLSIGCWLIFEYYNLKIQNWYYIGLPAATIARYFGYAWAFATIFPGIFETAEVVEASGLFTRARTRHRPLSKRALQITLCFGLGLLLYPILFPNPYIFALVWAGFIFFLGPVNYHHFDKSLLRLFERGELAWPLSLLLSGIICGFLWEFWNYWAIGKWVYTVPVTAEWKLFEMPAAGYLGFPPFALECWAMYLTARWLLRF